MCNFYSKNHYITYGVFLFGFFVVAFEQAQDFAVRGIHPTLLLMDEPVLAVVPCKFVSFGLVQFIENHVLDFFDMDRSCKGMTAFFYITDNEADGRIADLVIDLCICGCNCGSYLFTIIRDFSTVPFDDFHSVSIISSSASFSSSSQVLFMYFLHWLFRISRTTDCSSAVSSIPYIHSLSSASELTTVKVMLLSS